MSDQATHWDWTGGEPHSAGRPKGCEGAMLTLLRCRLRRSVVVVSLRIRQKLRWIDGVASTFEKSEKDDQ